MSTTAEAQIDPPGHLGPSARSWRSGSTAWVGARTVCPGVLVLYGEEHANLALADELALDGYEVRRAGDPAMLRARCDPGEVELVLFDRSSHRGAGLDVLRELRAGGLAPQVKPGLRTLWMSPNGELADVLRAFDAGADDVLRAPFA
jgi:DNA-binding response OmpR family regulator